MDSLKARALAFALPAALGLFLSGSAVVESHADDANSFAEAADPLADAFFNVTAPSSVSFVQRMPPVEVEEDQSSSATQSTGRSMRRLATFPDITERNPKRQVANYRQNTEDFSYTIVSPEKPVAKLSENQNSLATPSLEVAAGTVEHQAPLVSAETERLNTPVVAGVMKNNRVESAVQQFGQWDESVCNTPPLHKPVTGLVIEDGEPVIHVIRRELDGAVKEEFYSEQAATEKVASQDQLGPVLDLKPAGFAAAREQVDRMGKMPLRQPSDDPGELMFVDEPLLTKTDELTIDDIALENAVTDGATTEDMVVEGAAKFDRFTVAAQPQQQPSVLKTNAGPSRSFAGTTSPETGHWSPLDMRNMSVDRPLKEEKVFTASEATVADKAQARRAVQMGFELVQRRAHYSARARFVQALRIVARSMDDQTFTTVHTTALRNALAAYEEAVDFYPTSAKPDEDVNLHMILGGHNTPVLANIDTSRLTPRQCVREYMAYAEQEFVAALGQDGFASQALYGLGRLEASKETASTSAPQVRANRSLMLYQTAMLVDPRNYAAANELGVLLARYGKFETAIAAFQHCVMHSPEPTAWTNLANLYRRVGRPAEAQMAEMEANNTMARRAAGAPFVANQPRVEWVGPDAFVAMNADANMQIRSAPGPMPQVQQPVPVQRTNESVARKRPPTKKSGKSALRSLWPFKKQ